MSPEYPTRKSPHMLHASDASNITRFAVTPEEKARAEQETVIAVDAVAGQIADDDKRYAELQGLALDFARRGSSLELDRMIAAGLPSNLRDGKGQSLLMLAAYHGHADTVDTLLKRGAAPDLRNDRGQTPLGGAAFKGHDAVVRLLLDAGADAKADQGLGVTATMYATMFGRFSTARIIRDHIAATRSKSA